MEHLALLFLPHAEFEGHHNMQALPVILKSLHMEESQTPFFHFFQVFVGLWKY